MKLAMTTHRHNSEIGKLIVQRVFVNVVDNFVPPKFAAKVLLHDPSVLFWPLAGRGNFNGDIPESLVSDNPLGEQGESIAVVHPFFHNKHFTSFLFSLQGICFGGQPWPSK
jgi:hypothetical protein